MSKEMGLEFLGKVPLDPRIGKSCDEGKSFLDEWPDSPATEAYLDIVQRESQSPLEKNLETDLSGVFPGIRELLGDA